MMTAAGWGRRGPVLAAAISVTAGAVVIYLVARRLDPAAPVNTADLAAGVAGRAAVR
jgi:hypothetical protein